MPVPHNHIFPQDLPPAIDYDRNGMGGITTRAYAWARTVFWGAAAQILQRAHSLAANRAARCVLITFYIGATDITRL
jgi:hypothetical protein